MKKLIFRKFLLDTTNFFLISLISLSLIVWVMQAVNFLDYITEDGHGIKVYLYYTLLNLPKIISRILPTIFFISLFYTIIKYESNNELIIYWTNGIKKKQFMNVVIIFSIFFLLFQILLTSLVVPTSQNAARSHIRSSNIDFFPSLIKEKQFIDVVDKLTIFIEEKKSNGELKNIFLKEEAPEVENNQIVVAKKGNLITRGLKSYLVLYDGIFIKKQNKKIKNFEFKKTRFDLTKFATKTTTHPKIQELSTIKLIRCIKLFNADPNYHDEKDIFCKKSTVKFSKQELFKRLFIPFYIPVVSLIACFLILKNKEDYNYNFFKILIFVIAIIVIVISEISTRYSVQNDQLSIIFLFLPFLIFFHNYFIFLKRKT